MRTVLVAEPRAGASYAFDVLTATYESVVLVTHQTESLDYYKWLLEDSQVIWLTRDNKLDQLNSWIIAYQLNKWQWTSEHRHRLIELIPTVAYSTVAVDEFNKRLAFISELVRYKLQYHITTSYEQLLLDNELHPYKVKQQLGIDTVLQPANIATPYRHSSADYIINKVLKDCI